MMREFDIYIIEKKALRWTIVMIILRIIIAIVILIMIVEVMILY